MYLRNHLALYETQHCGNRPSMFSNVFKNMDFVACALEMEGNDNKTCIKINESSNLNPNFLFNCCVLILIFLYN